jgi:hypothetical protein
MNLLTKTLLINIVSLFVLLASLHYYPPYVVAISAGIIFPVANLGLFISARGKRRRSTGN